MKKSEILEKILKATITKKIVFLYVLLIICSVILTSISSYVVFQQLMDSQMSIIDANTSVIKTKLEKLYQKKTNIIELPDLNEKINKDKNTPKILEQTIQQNFPGYQVRIPTVEGTLEYKESPKLLYDTKENKYFLEVTREIKFSENLPFKSLQLSIKFNYYQLILKSLILGTLVAACILIPIMIFFSRTIVKPIIKVSKAAKRIAVGELDIYIDYKSQDELGELSDSFNYMSKELSNIKRIRDDLLATISHELRSPLGRIKGYTELLYDLKLKKAEQEIYFKSILQEIDFMNGMIGEIIEISRLELGKEHFFKEEIDLAFFLEIINEDLEVERSINNVNYIFDYEYELFCNIDIDKMRRVFQNILQNSVKANAKEIKITAKKHDKKIFITIIDDGVGISKEQLEIVFEKFYRIDKSRDRKTGGFGLGLAICKGIINEHGGDVYFVEREKGAELHIELPLADIKYNA
jgi:signal transduction histidine kinase